MTTEAQENPYLVMPIDQVRSDARNGVRLAREAWRVRDSESAAQELGRIIEPGCEREQVERQRRIAQAIGDFQRGQKDARRTKHAGRNAPKRTCPAPLGPALGNEP